MAVDVPTLRRYYLLKHISAHRVGNDALAAVWQAKQEAESGGPVLPDGFPGRALLVAAGYAAKEDLNGADVDELADYAQLSSRDAAAAIAAAAAL